jgi:uncharacterized protein YerC
MSQVSKYPISSDVAERIFGIFIKSFSSLKNKTEVEKFVYDLFTPTEKVMFAKRIAIAFLLLKGYQYRHISGILRVSLGTISSVQLSLKAGKGSYEEVLTRIMREENLEKVFVDTLEKIISIPAKSTKGGGTYRYMRDELRKYSKSRKKSF